MCIPLLLIISVPAISIILNILYAVHLSMKHDLPYKKAHEEESSDYFKKKLNSREPMGVHLFLTFWPIFIVFYLLFFVFVFYPYRLLLFTVKNLKKKD